MRLLLFLYTILHFLKKRKPAKRFRQVTGGPIFSALPEKMGEKGGGWVAFAQQMTAGIWRGF